MNIEEIINEVNKEDPELLKRKLNKRKLEIFLKKGADKVQAIKLLLNDNKMEDLFKEVKKDNPNSSDMGLFIKRIEAMIEKYPYDEPSNDNKMTLVKPFIQVGAKKFSRMYSQCVSAIVNNFNLQIMSEFEKCTKEINQLNKYVMMINDFKSEL